MAFELLCPGLLFAYLRDRLRRHIWSQESKESVSDTVTTAQQAERRQYLSVMLLWVMAALLGCPTTRSRCFPRIVLAARVSFSFSTSHVPSGVLLSQCKGRVWPFCTGIRLSATWQPLQQAVRCRHSSQKHRCSRPEVWRTMTLAQQRPQSRTAGTTGYLSEYAHF